MKNRYFRLFKTKQFIAWVLAPVFVVSANVRPVSAQAKHRQTVEKHFFVGVDNSGDKFKPDEFFNYPAMEELGIDFISYKYRGPKGTVEEEATKLKELLDHAKEKNLKIVFNVESGNWSLDMLSTDGHNWVKQPESLHQFRFPPEVLKNIHQSPAFWVEKTVKLTT